VEETVTQAPVTEMPLIDQPAEKTPVAEAPVEEAPEPAPVAEEPVAEAPVAEEVTAQAPTVTPIVIEPSAGAAVPVDADGDGVTDSPVGEASEPVVAEVVPVEEASEPAFEETVAVVDESMIEEAPATTIEEMLDAMNTEENVSSTFAEIQAGGLDNACYQDTDHYVAEFLYQNPEVCFWEVDESAQTVTAKPTPVVPDNAIRLPAPSGGDDTRALESVINSNAGKTVVGRGVYKVDELDINVKIDIFDMPMVPTSGAEEMVHINASDVRIFNSPIDGKGSNRTNVGFHVQNGSDRFVPYCLQYLREHHQRLTDQNGYRSC